jgi:hypothetical protein
MPTKTWKTVELKLAKILGGQRRGADFRDKFSGGGKSDIILDGFSIEVKHGKKMGWSLLLHALAQADINKDHEDDIPVAILHPEGMKYEDSLVTLKLSDFAKLIQSNEEPAALKIVL